MGTTRGAVDAAGRVAVDSAGDDGARPRSAACGSPAFSSSGATPRSSARSCSGSARVVAAAIVIGFVAVGPAWFWFGPSPTPGTTIRIALAQPGNIEDATTRQAAAEALTAELAGQRLDLVVWGESSVGVDLTSHPEAMTRLADLSRRVGADLLVNVDARAPGRRNPQVLGAHRSERSARLVLEDTAGAVRRIRAAAAAARLGHPAHQGCGRGPTSRRRTGVAEHPVARDRTADQLRGDVFRSPPPRSAIRSGVAGVSEFDVDVSGQLGAATVGEHGRGPRSRGGTPGGACGVIGRQFGIRRTRPRNSRGFLPPVTECRLWTFRSGRVPPFTNESGTGYWRWRFRSSSVPACGPGSGSGVHDQHVGLGPACDVGGHRP